MKIKLDLIAPSPRPVRTSWDEDKMNELAQSIKEQGLIVPIKVRPISDIGPCPIHGLEWLGHFYEYYNDNTGFTEGCKYCFILINKVEWIEPDDDDMDEVWTPVSPLFEIVYGHRRAEACRRAGLAEIECIAEGVDDTDVLIQALIENVQREDMIPYDVALGLQALKDTTGWSNQQVADAFGWSTKNTVFNYLVLLRPVFRNVASPADQPVGRQAVTHMEVMEARAGSSSDEDAVKVLEKTVKEDLSKRQTRQVAEAYRDAKDDREREAVLRVDPRGRDAFEIRRVARMQAGVEDMVDLERERKAKAFQDYDAAVKDFLESMRLFNTVIETAQSAVKYGKFSPEGARFAAGRVERLIDELTTLKGELDAIGNE